MVNYARFFYFSVTKATEIPFALLYMRTQRDSHLIVPCKIAYEVSEIIITSSRMLLNIMYH